MRMPDTEALRRLGDGESIESVAKAAGLTTEKFDLWWRRQAELRTPDLAGEIDAPVQADVEILRDGHGIPHIFASNDRDLFFGYGYAMAQDRLWQLDYYRRRGMGRLAEILGQDALEYDRLVRTVGINRIARRQAAALPEETLRLLEAFSSGINAVMDASRDRLPIEFDLLGYRPEPWSPVDTVAILAEFRWYLTGRLPVIFLPELAKRYLADPDLYRAFLTPEAGDESIVPPGSYPSAGSGSEPVGRGGWRSARLARQQQLGRGRHPFEVGFADGGERPAHRLRAASPAGMRPAFREGLSMPPERAIAECRGSGSAATGGWHGD